MEGGRGVSTTHKGKDERKGKEEGNGRGKGNEEESKGKGKREGEGERERLYKERGSYKEGEREGKRNLPLD